MEVKEKSSTNTLSGLSILMALVSQVSRSVEPKLGVVLVVLPDMVVVLVLLALLAAGLNLSTVVDTCAVSSIILVMNFW